MKKGKLSSILLLSVSVGCIANMSAVVAETVPPKATNKNVTTHKKIKPVPNRKITERDITECTRILNKATQIDRLSQKEMLAIAATNNSKISQHLKKPADVQLFASDDPAAVAHLTGKTVIVPPTPVLKNAKATKIPPIEAAVLKPAAKLPTPNAPKTNPKVFSADAPKAVASNTKPATAKLAVNPAVTKTTTPAAQANRSQPHIELFAPNTAADLDHLEGRSASLEIIQKPTSTDKATTASSKTKAKKSDKASTTNAKEKKQHS
jgi:hypothetical protein